MTILKAKLLFWHKGCSVVLQWLADDPCQYCIQYGGAGKYFPDLEGAIDYLDARFRVRLTAAEIEACKDFPAQIYDGEFPPPQLRFQGR